MFLEVDLGRMQNKDDLMEEEKQLGLVLVAVLGSIALGNCKAMVSFGGHSRTPHL